MAARNETLAALVEEVGAERVARLRVAPMSLIQAQRLFGAIGSGGMNGGGRRNSSAPPRPRRPSQAAAAPPPSPPAPPSRPATPSPPEASAALEPPDEVTQSGILLDVADDLFDVPDELIEEGPSGVPPPLPASAGRPTPSSALRMATFDSVLDQALGGEEPLGPMESVEAEIEVDFVEGLAEGEDKTELVPFGVLAATPDPLDLDQDEEYDVDVDVEAFARLEGPSERRSGFHPEDNEPTQAVRVDEFDLDPPPDAELNVRSSIKKLFRKK